MDAELPTRRMQDHTKKQRCYQARKRLYLEPDSWDRHDGMCWKHARRGLTSTSHLHTVVSRLLSAQCVLRL